MRKAATVVVVQAFLASILAYCISHRASAEDRDHQKVQYEDLVGRKVWVATNSPPVPKSCVSPV